MKPTSPLTALAYLVSVSRRYGADPEWVLAGGGNTSLKTADRLYIKASGFALATIGEDGFCEIDRTKLDAMWRRQYPSESKAREAAVLADLFAARVPGEEKRPSVETLLHSLFPQTYVVHTHPALINGLTCGKDGERVFNQLFSDEAIWVPFIEPGYTLAKAVSLKFDAFVAEKGLAPRFMLMQNHGFLAAADTIEEIDRISNSVMRRLREFIAERQGLPPSVSAAAKGAALEGAASVRASTAPRARFEPDFSACAVNARDLAHVVATLERVYRAYHTGVPESPGAPAAQPASMELCILHHASRTVLDFATDSEAFAPLAGAFTPDHIVYAGHEFLRADTEGAHTGARTNSHTGARTDARMDERTGTHTVALTEALADFQRRNGALPRVALVRGIGAFAIAAAQSPSASATAASRAMELFLDACKVATYSAAFGGALHMTPQAVEFIRTWEVEQYRAKVAAKG